MRCSSGRTLGQVSPLLKHDTLLQAVVHVDLRMSHGSINMQARNLSF